MQIAIDGPAGAGKSSVARRVASAVGAVYLDTGAMYRALTLKALQTGINLESEAELEALAGKTSISILPVDGGENKVYVDGRDVTDLIRSPQVNSAVSVVARCPAVRRQMVALQKEAARRSKKVILDGRDIGTNVLPNAEYKFFLTASLKERASRRRLELAEKGLHLTQEEVEKEIANRDKLDSGRPVNPLAKANDAIVIDTTDMSLPEVVEKILCLINGRPAEN